MTQPHQITQNTSPKSNHAASDSSVVASDSRVTTSIPDAPSLDAGDKMLIANGKPQLLGKSSSQLESLMREMGFPAFRGRQIAAWIYKRGAASFDDMNDLPRALRERLASTHALAFPDVTTRMESRDGSAKLLLQMGDGERIETVRLPFENRLSVCVSSQAGCAMACAFCATGLGGFRRNLSTAEIIAQPILASRIDDKRIDDSTRRVPRMTNGELEARDANSSIAAPFGSNRQSSISHIVFMGMGEPLLNVSNVLESIGLMHDEMGIPQRHITVSTVGILAGIERLASAQLQVTLAVSLHAPDDDLRHRLIPTSTKTRVSDIVGAAKNYVRQTGRRVTFEYVVLGGVNDAPQMARRLAALCRGWPCHVNLIPWNAVPDARLENLAFNAPDSGALREFRGILENSGVAVTQRVQRGADVAAACGQLRALDNDKERRAGIALVAR